MQVVGEALERYAPPLTRQDIGIPIEDGYIGLADTMLTAAGVEAPDEDAYEALGRYLQKGSALAKAEGGDLDEFYRSTPEHLRESGLLASLCSELVQARERADQYALEISRNPATRLLGYIRRRPELRELRRVAQEGVINITDLKPGDRVAFAMTEPAPDEWAATSEISGMIIGREQVDDLPTVLFEVDEQQRQIRNSNSEFAQPWARKGDVIRLAGTVLWNNSYRRDPSRITQGDALEAIDAQGNSTIVSSVIKDKYDALLRDPEWATNLRLAQVTINGTKIFPRHSPKYPAPRY